MNSSDTAANADNDLDPRDFERVRALIYQRAGIALNPTKRSMVQSRLTRRLRALSLDSFTAYLDRLESGSDDAPEWQQFVNALTTNLTSFFREAHHFPVLAQHLLESAGRAPLRVWCCAASTGEEPYTLAMTAIDAFKSRTPPVSILATDIDTAVLERARRGVFADETVERLDADLLKRHFLRGTGANAGHVRVRAELQALLSFRQLNLLAPRWPVQERFDAIFCRNVMIYFDKPTQHRVLERLAAHLNPDGLLFAGHSENFTQSRDVFELQGKTVYRLASRLRKAA